MPVPQINPLFEMIMQREMNPFIRALEGIDIGSLITPVHEGVGGQYITPITPQRLNPLITPVMPEDDPYIREMPLLMPEWQEQIGEDEPIAGGMELQEWGEKAANLIEEKVQGASATPEQIRGILKEAKGEELGWKGVDEYLSGKTKVNKNDFIDYLHSKALRLEETWKVDKPKAYLDANEAPLDKVPTKFSQWQLPGGENYKELLLRMPAKKQEVRGIVEKKDYQSDRPYTVRLSTESEHLQSFEREEDAQRYAENLTNKYNMRDYGKDVYKSSHWDEPNVLAHARMDDRVVGKDKTLFVEEIQSDWHREGREIGYGDTRETVTAVGKFKVKSYDGNSSFQVEDEEGNAILATGSRERAEEKARELNQRTEPVEITKKATSGVPNAPFKKNWHEVVMRKLVRHAVENGYDRVAWISGEQTADRYDLSKQVKEISWRKKESGTTEVRIEPKETSTIEMNVDKNGNVVASTHTQFDNKKLEDVVGKDHAKTILEGGEEISEDRFGYRAISGEALKIGGEWAHNLYDKMIPQYMNKLGKKYGVKVEEVNINKPAEKGSGFREGQEVGRSHYIRQITNGEWGVFDKEKGDLIEAFNTKKEAMDYIGETGTSTQLSLKLTPEMKKEFIRQ